MEGNWGMGRFFEAQLGQRRPDVEARPKLLETLRKRSPSFQRGIEDGKRPVRRIESTGASRRREQGRVTRAYDPVEDERRWRIGHPP